MKLIKRIQGKKDKTGKKTFQSFGLFLCPYCKKEVEKYIGNGKRDKSCGCVLGKLITKSKTIHGDSGKRLYHTWQDMKKRCYSKHSQQKKWYQDKGILVCDEWINNYQAFKIWALRNGYKNNLQLDRVDNDGNYNPDNCQFITCLENIRKKPGNKLSFSDAIDIRELYKNKNITHEQISKIYCVDRSLIGYVINNKIWVE